MELQMEQIIGIILLMLFFYTIYVLIKSNKDRIKKLDMISNNDPSLKQETRIIKLRETENAELGKFYKHRYLILIIVLLIFALVFYLFVIRTCNYDRWLLFFIVFLIIIAIQYILIKIVYKKQAKRVKKFIINDLQTKYGNINELSIPHKEIVEGRRTEVGNIRNVYLFSYKIEKYNCTLTGYYQEKLVKDKSYSSDNFYHYYYHYVVVGFFLDYVYKIENTELNTLDGINPTVLDLSKTRIMSVNTNKPYLSIKKETVLYGYNANDSHIDTDDVKIFYDKLVKEIEARNNGHITT